MIEPTIISYLADQLGVPVYGEIPPNPPITMVTVEKTGGRRTNLIDAATLAIQSWAPSTEQAARLNDRVKAAMSDAVELDSISSVELNSDYNFADQVRKRPRYQAVFDLVYYD